MPKAVGVTGKEAGCNDAKEAHSDARLVRMHAGEDTQCCE